MLTSALVFLLLLLVLLAIPVTLKFQVIWKESLRDDIRLQWCFGLVRVKIPPLLSQGLSSKPNDKSESVIERTRSRRKKPNVFAAVRRGSFRRRILRFARDLWHAVYKKDLRLFVRLGLGDPADTGQLWAVVGPIAGVLASAREATVRIEPDFFDDISEVESSGTIRLIPLQMLYLVAGLLLSPPIWRGIWQNREAS